MDMGIGVGDEMGMEIGNELGIYKTGRPGYLSLGCFTHLPTWGALGKMLELAMGDGEKVL